MDYRDNQLAMKQQARQKWLHEKMPLGFQDQLNNCVFQDSATCYFRLAEFISL